MYSLVIEQAIALMTLVVQNSALALVMRYTREPGHGESMYIPSTAVFMAEVCKLLVALGAQYRVSREANLVVDTCSRAREPWLCSGLKVVLIDGIFPQICSWTLVYRGYSCGALTFHTLSFQGRSACGA